MNDKNYWSEYYLKNNKPTDPSDFAKFILSKVDKNKTLIELGCGNGRDSVFFSKYDFNVIGVDQVENEVNFLNENYAKDNLTFVCDDFSNLKNSDNELIKTSDFDYVYSRFTFHSINEKKEDRTLDWIRDNLRGGLFFLEARSINDPMFKLGKNLSHNENFTNHYRRYMNLDVFCDKLESRNFEILYKIEDKDLAPHKDENPYVVRIIAKVD